MKGVSLMDKSLLDDTYSGKAIRELTRSDRYTSGILNFEYTQ